MIIGFEASHTVVGGAVAHLKNLLSNVNFKKHKIDYIYVWAPTKTIALLPKHKKIIYLSHILLNFNLISKIFWQLFFFSKQLKKKNCNIAFVTGGYFFTHFKPIVTISQNVLPFLPKQLIKYFFSFFYLKMVILRFLSILSFNRANKVIFLSEYSRNIILEYLKKNIITDLIPHGIDLRLINFFKKNKRTKKKMIKIIFVSDITFYKNHHNVLIAVASLRKNYNIKLQLIGGQHPKCFDKLIVLKNKLDPKNEFISYQGLLTNKKTLQCIKKSNIFLFSSWCESFSVSILEGMSSGNPMIISDIPIFREILGSNCIYFDIDNVEDLKSKLIKVINLTLNQQKILKNRNYKLLSSKYSQKIVREKTFSSLRKVFDNYYS